MNWADLGVVAELIGAVGVVASLAYVAQQVRQNTRALRMANAAAAQNNFQHLARFLYEDRQGCALILRAMQDPGELTPAERLSAYAYFFDFMKTAEVAHHNYLNGDLDEAFWEASLRFYRAYFSTPGFRTYWGERRTAFMPEFQEAMDQWLAAGPPATRPDELVAAKPNRDEP
jgi:hypothetical protein